MYQPQTEIDRHYLPGTSGGRIFILNVIMYNRTASVLTCTGTPQRTVSLESTVAMGERRKWHQLPYDAAQYNRDLNITEIELINNQPTTIYVLRSQLNSLHQFREEPKNK